MNSTNQQRSGIAGAVLRYLSPEAWAEARRQRAQERGARSHTVRLIEQPAQHAPISVTEPAQAEISRVIELVQKGTVQP